MIRRLATLYGGRPGTIGFLRLTRRAIGHLAITGGMAAGESLFQQVLGHGIAARISTRLGEGVINGILTARIGLAAIDVCRPLPFVFAPQPRLADIIAELTRREADEAEGPANPG
jgi:putative membrane protein